MSNCCKGKCWMKFLPHNWLCLKGLSVLFVVCFYICLAIAIYSTYKIITHPMITGIEMWIFLATYVGSILASAVVCLTVSKILKALRKIDHAVAPCCCHGEEKKEEKAN